jgi:hypothetical protein
VNAILPRRIPKATKRAEIERVRKERSDGR